MDAVNGKTYPMWGQFVDKKAEWIGGKLQEIDNIFGEADVTEITDVTLEPNGEESAILTFHGKDYGCGYDVKYSGIGGEHTAGWLTVSSTWGDRYRVKRRIDP